MQLVKRQWTFKQLQVDFICYISSVPVPPAKSWIFLACKTVGTMSNTCSVLFDSACHSGG